MVTGYLIIWQVLVQGHPQNPQNVQDLRVGVEEDIKSNINVDAAPMLPQQPRISKHASTETMRGFFCFLFFIIKAITAISNHICNIHF